MHEKFADRGIVPMSIVISRSTFNRPSISFTNSFHAKTGENLWVLPYPLRLLGANFGRMVTIVRLGSGKLVIHSTGPFTPADSLASCAWANRAGSWKPCSSTTLSLSKERRSISRNTLSGAAKALQSGRLSTQPRYLRPRNGVTSSRSCESKGTRACRSTSFCTLLRAP